VIRTATEEDLFDLTILCREFIKEVGPPLKFDKGKIETFLTNAILSDVWIVLVMESEGEVTGLLVGVVSEHPFLPMVMASELGWFVSREKRGSIEAIKLIKHFEQWAKNIGANLISLTDEAKLNDISKIYQRLGYNLMERTYTKDI